MVWSATSQWCAAHVRSVQLPVAEPCPVTVMIGAGVLKPQQQQPWQEVWHAVQPQLCDSAAIYWPDDMTCE
jgi:hypothetical protein